MREISSEAVREGIIPPENMTDEEFQAWRESLAPDMMGFDGDEGVQENE